MSTPAPSRAPGAVAVAVTAAALCVGLARAYRPQPPPDRVGACSAYATCRDATCHASFPIGSATLVSQLTLDPPAPLPPAWVPGRTYALRLEVADTSVQATGWGFELAALLDCWTGVPRGAGSLGLVEPGRTAVFEDLGIDYVSHACTCPSEDPSCCGYVPAGAPGLIAWSFTWTAPARGSGDVTFNMAFNAANRDGTPMGDRISLAELVLPEEACPPPVDDLRVAKAACDPSEPGAPRLALSWTPSGSPARVRVARDLATLAGQPPEDWPLEAGTCLPLGTEPLAFVSVAEDCALGSEGVH